MISLYRPRHAVFGAGAGPRLGVYAFGGCDLEPVLALRPLIAKARKGPCAIRHEELYSGSRSDLILQGLTQIPLPHVAPFCERMGVPLDYFRPRVFEPAFAVRRGARLELFPKRAVVLSWATDIRRPLYRHRLHGFLADPGAWWFGHGAGKVLSDPATAEWFWREFRSVGRLSLRRSMDNLSAIVSVLRARSGLAIVVLNGRYVEGDGCESRRRAFNGALRELSRALDFDVLDFDRLAPPGAGRGLDLPRPPATLRRPVARALFESLRERDVFAGG